MTAPLVLVPSYRLASGRVEGWTVGAHAVPEPYVAALERAGGHALAVPATRGSSAPEVLDRVDGLLLIGGGDVEPGRYGGAPHERIYGVDAERDALEIALVREAVGRRLPVLAICRGAQVVNVAFGGTLLPHLPDDPRFRAHGSPPAPNGSTHQVSVAAGSALGSACGSAALVCSSRHHQGIDALGSGLVVTATSRDGLVEAVEGRTGWLLGVQWHPEDTADRDPGQQALFDAFVREAARPRA